MAVEIERKYLVADDSWRAEAGPGRHIRQAYLAASPGQSIRIRIIDDGQAWLTIKSGYRGIVRDEFEYEVPLADALAMLELCQGGVIEKTRYRVSAGSLIWDIDVFAGDNDGLVVAEIELDDEAQEVAAPAWLGREVTGDARYQNSRLADAPFNTWQQPG